MNDWDDESKAAYLASSLKGPALVVLGNLSVEKRQNYAALTGALENRFGISHQTDLSRVRFKNRVKQREETLPKLSEDIERLSRLAYPDAPPSLQDVLARDQFIDSLPEEEIRLRLKQEKPQNLRKALELALELESFQLAARQRQRYAIEVTLGDATPSSTYVNNSLGRTPEIERVNASNSQIMKVVERLETTMERCMQNILTVMGDRRRRRSEQSCWKCGATTHLRRDCPELARQDSTQSPGREREALSSNQGNGQ